MNKIVNIFNKIGQFLKEVKVELKKVTWASRAELKNLTLIVLFSVAIMAIIIGSFDFIMSKIIDVVIH